MSGSMSTNQLIGAKHRFQGDTRFLDFLWSPPNSAPWDMPPMADDPWSHEDHALTMLAGRQRPAPSGEPTDAPRQPVVMTASPVRDPATGAREAEGDGRE